MDYLEMARNALAAQPADERNEANETNLATSAHAPDDDHTLCRQLEIENGLPRGSIVSWRPSSGCPGCGSCRPSGTEPPPDPEEDLASVFKRLRGL